MKNLIYWVKLNKFRRFPDRVSVDKNLIQIHKSALVFQKLNHKIMNITDKCHLHTNIQQSLRHMILNFSPLNLLLGQVIPNRRICPKEIKENIRHHLWTSQHQIISLINRIINLLKLVNIVILRLWVILHLKHLNLRTNRLYHKLNFHTNLLFLRLNLWIIQLVETILLRKTFNLLKATTLSMNKAILTLNYLIDPALQLQISLDPVTQQIFTRHQL